MQTTTFISTCLTFDKLKAYSEHRISKTESEQLYLHISTCELCTCAVNGYSAIPFTSTEIITLNKKADTISNATIAQSYKVTQIFISIISLLSIIGFYTLSNSISKEIKSNVKIQPKQVSSFVSDKADTPTSIFVTNETKVNETKNTVPIKRPLISNDFEKIAAPPLLTPRDINKIITAETKKEDSEVILFNYNSDVKYIYDLKITDYNSLYFVPEKETFDYHNYTSSFKENKESLADDFPIEKQDYEAHQLLNQGLYCFNKGRYNHALSNFNLLIENNRNDINALFYAALCYYKLNKTQKAIDLFTTILENTNNTFQPEAEWHLALCYLKNGEKEKTKTLLQKIQKEKSFYSKKAMEELKKI